jgi:hypothetical protein
MTNILFIAFQFPPLNEGGVFRSLAFVKYLPQFGINPIVVTLHKDSFKDVYVNHSCDESLGKEVIEKTTLIPIPAEKALPKSKVATFASIYFTIHGNEVNHWKKPFFEKMGDVIAQYEPKAIFATVPPFSVLPLASELAARYKLPLLLDFRDAWSQWRMAPYGTYLHYLRTLQLEKKYLRAANAIIATSRQTLDDFQRLHSGVPEKKFHYVPNGYTGVLNTWQPIDAAREEFTIGYVGSFYYSPDARAQMLTPWWRKKGHRMLQYIPHQQDWLYRSPYFFFRALRLLIDTDPQLGKKIRVKFVGKKPSWLMDMIKSFELEEQVSLLGEFPHKQSLQFQQECDALLITSARQMKGKDYSIAGKTFEYLQMQRPVIAFVCEGAQKDLLSDAGTALICDPDDTQRAVGSITSLFKGNLTLTPNKTFLDGLSREALTRQLSDIIKIQAHAV